MSGVVSTMTSVVSSGLSGPASPSTGSVEATTALPAWSVQLLEHAPAIASLLGALVLILLAIAIFVLAVWLMLASAGADGESGSDPLPLWLKLFAVVGLVGLVLFSPSAPVLLVAAVVLVAFIVSPDFALKLAQAVSGAEVQPATATEKQEKQEKQTESMQEAVESAGQGGAQDESVAEWPAKARVFESFAVGSLGKMGLADVRTDIALVSRNQRVVPNAIGRAEGRTAYAVEILWNVSPAQVPAVAARLSDAVGMLKRIEPKSSVRGLLVLASESKPNPAMFSGLDSDSFVVVELGLDGSAKTIFGEPRGLYLSQS